MPGKQVLLIGALCLAALAGVATLGRGPDPVALPQMAEQPVTLPDGRALYVQKFELTVAEWTACHEAGACDLALRAPAGEAPEEVPATGLSYIDARQYLDWITRTSGHPFRLPSAAEWGRVARDVLPPDQVPLFEDPRLAWAAAYSVEEGAPRDLRPSGAFSTSAEGVADLDGSVWEWTAECYRGSAGGTSLRDCAAYYLGGEHVTAMFFLERDPARGGCAVGIPPAHLGMRLVSDAPW